MTQYVYHTCSIDEDIANMTTTPLDQLLSLRSQCESQAKHQALYTRRDKNWLEYEPRTDSNPVVYLLALNTTVPVTVGTRRNLHDKRPRPHTSPHAPSSLSKNGSLSHSIRSRHPSMCFCPTSIPLSSHHPPCVRSRVGIMRKLRLNVTLKREGLGFVLDMTAARSHKTSKVCIS